MANQRCAGERIGTEKSVLDDSKLLTVEDMAAIFRAPTPAAFRERYKRDKLRPPEKRLIPDPISGGGRGQVLYWSPVAVAAVLRGEGIPKRKRG